jgi:hypothetical protein
MKAFTATLAGVLLALSAHWAAADPVVGGSTVIGPFAGPGAALHSGNTSPYTIDFAGTDLGWSYVHDGDLRFLFGDTHATEAGAPVDPGYRPASGHTAYTFDDAFGTVDLGSWNDPTAFSPTTIPTILLGQHATSSDAKAVNPGHWMDAFKTPSGGWSNGSREFAIFYTSKPQGCLTDSHCDDHLSDLTCDQGLAFWNEEYYDQKSFTGVCVDGTFGCLNDTMVNIFGWPIAGTGFCTDETSTMHDIDDAGRILSTGVKLRVGIRNTTDERQYDNTKEWLTNKFMNVAVTTVQDFVPANGSGSANQNYNVAASSGNTERVFLWGRPGYVGVNANNRNLGLYFAYVDMPTGSSFSWAVNYYTGTSSGIPQFSSNESDAVALDLDSGTGGIQATEVHDIVALHNVVWIDHLDKWVMLYGGKLSTNPLAFGAFSTCGVLEFFVGADDCQDVDQEDGAIYMRTADDPWGPWSPPQEFFNPGDPDASPPTGEYASGGILYHPDCSGSCVASYDHPGYDTDVEYGLLYAPNIIVPWIDAVGDDVDVIWNLSTWNPYGVVLLRTRIEAN